MKKLIATIILVFFVILIIGYVATKSPQEPPKIVITIGNKQLDCITAKNQWNGVKYDREDSFKSILKKVSENAIPYIEIGSTATVNFTKNCPSKLTITDILIDKNGNQIYSEKLSVNIPVELNNGIGSFEIKDHWASELSSYYEEGKTNIRGFRMIATWGKNECEYAFIIRTD